LFGLTVSRLVRPLLPTTTRPTHACGDAQSSEALVCLSHIAVSELERLAEIERQRELERLAEIERQRELERLAEIERQRELERLAEIERLAELERLAEIERLAELEIHAGVIRNERLSKEEYRMAAVHACRSFSASEVCFMYKVSRRTLFRWKRQWDETQTLKPKPITGRPPKLGENDQARLLCLFATNPNTTNTEASRFLGNIKPRTVSDYLKKAGFAR